MNKLEFIQELQLKKVDFNLENESIIITDKGGFYLTNLTSLPENTEFNNKGDVYLRALTSLPQNTEFNNQGDVDLRALTSLPENTEFNNQGDVYLRALTSLPENTEFNNQGYVYLRALTGINRIILDAVPVEIQDVDNITMLVLSKKKLRNDITILKCLYFKGATKISEMQGCFVAKKSDYYAHASSVRQAIADVMFKLNSANFNKDDLIHSIKEKGVVTISDYRLLTGACSQGVDRFLKDIGLDGQETMLLNDVISSVKGHYGGDYFIEIFGRPEDT